MLDFSGKHELEAGTDASFLNGQRSTDHREISKIAYDLDAEGVKYTVTTEIKGKSEQFTNFYTNKKAPHLVSSKPNEGNTPAGVRNRNTNTFSGAQVRNEEASSGAKLQKVSEKDKQETEKSLMRRRKSLVRRMTFVKLDIFCQTVQCLTSVANMSWKQGRMRRS